MFPLSFLTCPQKNRLVEKAIGLEGFGQIESAWSDWNRLHAPPIKGTVSRDFLLLVFFMNQFPPSPRVCHLDRFKFFWKFVEIFASQCAPPVSTTPEANFPQVSTKPAAKLPPVSTTLAANFATSFASCWYRWQIMGNIRLLRPKWTWRQKCIYKLTLLPK